jgi:hypothetical protein
MAAGGSTPTAADRAPQPAGQSRREHPVVSWGARFRSCQTAGGHILFEASVASPPALRQAAVAELYHLLIVDEGELIALRQHLLGVSLPAECPGSRPIQQRRPSPRFSSCTANWPVSVLKVCWGVVEPPEGQPVVGGLRPGGLPDIDADREIGMEAMLKCRACGYPEVA